MDRITSGIFSIRPHHELVGHQYTRACETRLFKKFSPVHELLVFRIRTHNIYNSERFAKMWGQTGRVFHWRVTPADTTDSRRFQFNPTDAELAAEMTCDIA